MSCAPFLKKEKWRPSHTQQRIAQTTKRARSGSPEKQKTRCRVGLSSGFCCFHLVPFMKSLRTAVHTSLCRALGKEAEEPASKQKVELQSHRIHHYHSKNQNDFKSDLTLFASFLSRSSMELETGIA
jgi:hypothetical protein